MKSEKTKLFIKRATGVHGGRYDYSMVAYTSAHVKVTILCREHGSFTQTANSHLRGRGCYECGRDAVALKLRAGANDFITRAKAVHGNTYDYGSVKYLNNRTRVEIVCTEHGSFYQTPSNHLKGHSCKACASSLRGSKSSMSMYEFISKSNRVHGEDTYDYSGSKYSSNKSKISIRCEKHGLFEQIASNHLRGAGCRFCGWDASGETKSLASASGFIERLRRVHGGVYDYSNSVYSGSKGKIRISCKKHGDFEQSFSGHESGKGCRLCHIKKSGHTFIYILKNDKGQSKIGISVNPIVRARVLSKESPFDIKVHTYIKAGNFNDAYKIEQLSHKKLAEKNSGYSGFDGSTEWFDVTPSMAERVVNEAMKI